MRKGFLNRGGADNNWNSPLPLTMNCHAGHYTACLKFSTLLWTQVRAFAASLIVKLGDWVTLLKI